MSKKTLQILAVCSPLLVIAGCTTQSEASVPIPTQITLQEAREFQNATLADLGRFVESGAVIGGMQAPIPQMAGLTCDWASGANALPENSGVLLPGGYDIEVEPTTDLDGVRSEIQETYAALSGWETEWRENDGDRELLIISPQKYKFYLSAYVVAASGNLRLDISSFSPCLKAPEGFTLFDEY